MRKALLILFILSLSAGLVWLGCETEPTRVIAPDTEETMQAAKVALPPVAIERVMAVQNRHTPQLMGIPGVVGTATGLGPDGKPAVLVLTKAPGVAGIPGVLDDVPVVVNVTGEIRALKKPSNPGKPPAQTVDPTARFERPVPIGVSTGNVGECSAGTIGARVISDGNVYALSNNHVYALENNAPVGSKVLQPGLYDTGCVSDENNVIGTLAVYEPINFNGPNTIDAAIALCPSENLRNSTPSDGYGTPKSTPVQADLGQKVQKYGRSSKLTKGQVTGINASFNVIYSTGTAYFTNLIIVESRKSFIKAGDSGSLLVTDPDRNPVGLLFAGTGNGKLALANDIFLVLESFDVSIDGEDQ